MDSVRTDWNSAADSIAMLEPATKNSMGPVTAWRFDLFCGDCGRQEYYVADGECILALRTEEDISIAGSWADQERVLRRELDTFRWAR